MGQLPISILSNSCCDAFRIHSCKRRKTCPPGWQPYPISAGRILVGGEESAGLFTHGDPLNSGEDRQHSHSFSGSFPTSNMEYYAKLMLINDRWGELWTSFGLLQSWPSCAQYFLSLTDCDFVCRHVLFQWNNIIGIFWPSLHSIAHLQELWEWYRVWLTSQCLVIQRRWLSQWSRCDLGQWQFRIEQLPCCTSSKWTPQCPVWLQSTTGFISLSPGMVW